MTAPGDLAGAKAAWRRILGTVQPATKECKVTILRTVEMRPTGVFYQNSYPARVVGPQFIGKEQRQDTGVVIETAGAI